ncbi:DUF1788 domain-containing protein [Priestia megaterium]|uniref:DUF1788 domain-containing protein n=1 Tax=Priestia megaterium TaxID=1404 RepID=UPI00048F2C6F|nr:DUF1788 domain-containing protein [Priestia megaterium]MEB2275530.1 DUF1788 domain-containing protein [Bacillus sp. ILBB4]WKU21128.1 DUF1788 domain-containing protein [Priestia megaterium]
MDIQKKLDRFFEEIQKEDFLKMRGLGNEVPYFVFDYEPEYEIMIRKSIKYHSDKLPVEVKVLNLFEMMIGLFEDISLDGLKQFEEDEGTEELFDAMRPTLEEETLVERIGEEAEDTQILLITGIGSVFQLIRTHELLNQLHAKVTNTPVIVFYPGTYTGQGLSLFNRFDSNGYYRAFSI